MSSPAAAKLNMADLTDLSGKVALVTGGGTGMYELLSLSLMFLLNLTDFRGLMIAKGLASNGAKVYIAGRRLEVLQKTASEHHIDGAGSLSPYIPTSSPCLFQS